MPTRVEFELAADKFETAATMLSDLITSTSFAGAADILRGGSLGRQVPERISAASASARSCRAEVLDAAETCRQRAGIIADYETRLDAYLVAMADFEHALQMWGAQQEAWVHDTTGQVADPGPAPVAPSAPAPPPRDWADVQTPAGVV